MLQNYFKKTCKRDQIIILVVICIIGMYASEIPLGYLCHKIFLIPSSLLSDKVIKEIQKIKDSGSPYLVEQIIPAPVPANENAAPYYNSAIDECIKVNQETDIELPGEIRYDFYKSYEFTQKDSQKVSAYLSKYQGVFELLYAAYDKSNCRFDLDYEKVWEGKVPDYLRIRNITYLISLSDIYLIQNKQYQEAVNLTARGLRLAYCVNTRPFSPMIAHMAEISCFRILYDPLNYMAENNITADYTAVLNEINTILQSQQNMMVKSMETERVFCLDTFEKMRNGYRLDDNSYKLLRSKNKLKNSMWSYALVYDELHYLKYMDKIISRLKEGNLENFSQQNPKWNLMLLSAVFAFNVSRPVEHDRKITAEYTLLKSKLEQLNKK